MHAESVDLLAEAEALHAFLGRLTPDDWQRPTQFKGWTPWDVVAHLHFFDEMSLAALDGEAAFAARRDALLAQVGQQRTNQEIGRETYAGLDAPALLERWISVDRQLATRLGECDAKRRLPWFGPDMGVRMFTTARLMETWAHGQEIYDLMRVRRAPTDRLKHIATIGVRTFGWTFVNRGLEPPGPPPHVVLRAPSGAVWRFNEPNERECIEGTAEDFCFVVTQVRNVADTRLRVTGPIATRWMSIAQCFAGGAADPPKPGERTGR